LTRFEGLAAGASDPASEVTQDVSLTSRDQAILDHMRAEMEAKLRAELLGTEHVLCGPAASAETDDDSDETADDSDRRSN